LSAVPVPADPAPVVEVLSADKVYADGTRALHPIDLAIRPGEFVTLLGPSGCGKSTLLKMIANLITPSDGRLRWWRQGFERVGEPGRTLVMVFQDATLMPWARVQKNVRLPLDLAGAGRAEADARVAEALALVGLTGFERHYPRQLSGGQEQRVGIARAIVADPTFLLCDEPTGDLDRKSADEVLELIDRLVREHGKTVLMVTHDPLAADRARVVLHLEKGVLVEAVTAGRAP